MVVELAVLRQGFAKHSTEEERCWGGRGLRQGKGAAALLSIYRGKGEGGRAPPDASRGGGGQADWISLGKILGRLAPQAKQVEDCLPSQVEAPSVRR